MTHVLTTEGPIRYPGGKDGTYRTHCSCGTYSSGFYASPSRAEKAGNAHATAKNENTLAPATAPHPDKEI